LVVLKDGLRERRGFLSEKKKAVVKERVKRALQKFEKLRKNTEKKTQKPKGRVRCIKLNLVLNKKGGLVHTGEVTAGAVFCTRGENTSSAEESNEIHW